MHYSLVQEQDAQSIDAMGEGGGEENMEWYLTGKQWGTAHRK